MAGDFLTALFESPGLIHVDDVGEFLRSLQPERRGGTRSIDWAIEAGHRADRLGYAFAGGYQAALGALVPGLPHACLASLCATEAQGNHPRRIETRLERTDAGWALTGSKRFATMGPLADILLIFAVVAAPTHSTSSDAGSPSQSSNPGAPPERRSAASRLLLDDRAAPERDLRLVMVRSDSERLRINPMSEMPFVPEVPHAAIELDGVAVEPPQILPGDGYADYVKPFRTVEDIHVCAGALAYVLSAAQRYGFPQALREELVALLALSRTLAALDPRAAETHLTLAGWLTAAHRLMDSTEELWQQASADERDRWYRDRSVLQVAAKARDQRRARAWSRFATG
jgi:alkylation response protein AidB-like acyl-CoA dehydrogenase